MLEDGGEKPPLCFMGQRQIAALPQMRDWCSWKHATLPRSGRRFESGIPLHSEAAASSCHTWCL